MALVPVDHQQMIWALCVRGGVCVEMPNPVQACLVIIPSIQGRLDHPVAREGAVRVSISEVVSALHHDKRRDTPAVGTDALDHGN